MCVCVWVICVWCKHHTHSRPDPDELARDSHPTPPSVPLKLLRMWDAAPLKMREVSGVSPSEVGQDFWDSAPQLSTPRFPHPRIPARDQTPFAVSHDPDSSHV